MTTALYCIIVLYCIVLHCIALYCIVQTMSMALDGFFDNTVAYWLVHHPHPALFHGQALVLDRLLTFLMAFSILVLIPSFPQSFRP